MSYITSSKSSINHLWEMDRANYTLLLHFMCVRIWGVCTCVCNPEVNRWCLPQLLSTVVFWQRVSHWLQSSSIQLGWLAPEIHLALTPHHWAFTDLCCCTQLLWVPGFKLGSLGLRSHHFTNWANSTASILLYFWGSILMICPCWSQIPKLQRFFCFSLPSDGVVGACHIPHHQTSLLQMFSSGSWHGNW